MDCRTAFDKISAHNLNLSPTFMLFALGMPYAKKSPRSTGAKAAHKFW